MHKFKRFWRFFLTLSLCLIAFSCSKITQANFDKIKTGMTMQEVTAILGEPTNSESINIGGISGTSSIWKDSNGEIDIQFLNNKVVVKSFSKSMEKKKDPLPKTLNA